jgi:P2-like prophage tail protein X
MSRTYVARDGDMIDAVAASYYGDTAPETLRRVLDANPGLAAIGPRLPAGTRIELPDIPKPATVTEGVRLW